MPGRSTKWKTPWPLLTESASMRNNIADMALALDNIAKDRTQNTLANRPPPGNIGSYFYATDYNILFRDNGSAWTLASGTHLVQSPSLMPSNPDDGMVVDYLADATLGIVWRFKYRAAATSSYKWEFQGNGPSLFAISSPLVSTISPLWNILPGGPSVNIPLAGEWLFEYGAHIFIGDPSGGVAIMSPDLYGAFIPLLNDAVYHDQQVYYNPIGNYLQSQMMNMGSREKIAQIASPRAVSMFYTVSISGRTGQFSDRWIKATPVRVG